MPKNKTFLDCSATVRAKVDLIRMHDSYFPERRKMTAANPKPTAKTARLISEIRKIEGIVWDGAGCEATGESKGAWLGASRLPISLAGAGAWVVATGAVVGELDSVDVLVSGLVD